MGGVAAAFGNHWDHWDSDILSARQLLGGFHIKCCLYNLDVFHSKSYQIMKGSDLIFIGRIRRDGTGITDVSKERIDLLAEVEFQMIALSETTYIAYSGIYSYTVKMKS